MCNDLKLDSFQRFIFTKEGFECLSCLFQDNNVISKDPRYAIKYKLERTHLNFSQSQSDQLAELAYYLADAKHITTKYLSTEWKDIIEYDKSLCQIFQEEDISTSFHRSIMPFKSGLKNIISLRVAWIPAEKSQNVAISTILSPFLTLASGIPQECQLAILFGPWILYFDENEVCIPKRYTSMNDFYSVEVESLECGDQVAKYIDKIANVIADWNTSGKFRLQTDSLDFVDAILKSVGSGNP